MQSSSLPLRWCKLLIGLFLYGIGISLMVRANAGVAPWDVLTQGMVNVTGLSFGLLTVLIGAAVLLLWWPIGQRPGIGTVLNVLLIGPAAEVGLWLFTEAAAPWQQVLQFSAGLLVLAFATGLYIGARFGPGPRDGLMTGLHARYGWPIWAVRTGIEGSVLLVGWVLGGTVGLGTVAFAVLIGPLVGRFLRWLDPPPPVAATAAG